MIDNENETQSYVEVLCELRWNSTEPREKLEEILDNFIEGESLVDPRFDGTYLVRRTSQENGLQMMADWVREKRQLDTVRKRLFRSIVGNMTAIYFNRQAAAMHRIALVDVNDDPPLGSIAFQIVSDYLPELINKLTPPTHKGIEITVEELEKLKQKKKSEIARKLQKNASKY